MSPYRQEPPIPGESKMSFERRQLARRIIESIRTSESFADQRASWSWFDQKGVGLLREALDEIDHLETVLAERAL